MNTLYLFFIGFIFTLLKFQLTFPLFLLELDSQFGAAKKYLNISLLFLAFPAFPLILCRVSHLGRRYIKIYREN